MRDRNPGTHLDPRAFRQVVYIMTIVLFLDNSKAWSVSLWRYRVPSQISQEGSRNPRGRQLITEVLLHKKQNSFPCPD